VEDIPNLFEYPQDGVLYKSVTLEFIPDSVSLSVAFQILIQRLFAEQAITRLELSRWPVFFVECAEYRTG